jgi:uncharacterized protein (TIGR00369 family)
MTDESQLWRREWFRRHWERDVAFNRLCGLWVRRWDPDGVELVVPFADQLAAHEGIFHGGVLAALVDTAATGAVMAGHDFANGSRLATVSMSVQYLSSAPHEDAVAYAHCTRRGRQLHFAEVVVRSAVSDKALVQGLVTASISGERPGLPTSPTTP